MHLTFFRNFAFCLGLNILSKFKFVSCTSNIVIWRTLCDFYETCLKESVSVPLISAVILGLIQGFAELFPFSSLGLLVILPHVVHLHVPTQGSRYLPFLVALHAGTAIALLLLFRHEWIRIVRGWFLWLRGTHTDDGRLAWLLIWGTIPTGLVGLILKHPLEHLFSKPLLAAIFLIVNGLIMFGGDRWYQNRRSRKVPLHRLSVGSAFKIGLFQILALIPGLSRSGSTMTGGVGQGLSFEDAAHFSFLLATPIILAASVLELPKLHGGLHGLLVPSLVGGILAGITAWLSAKFLLRYFRLHNLSQFAWISIAVGVLGVILIH